MSVAVLKPWKTSRIGGAQLAIVGCGDVGLRLIKHIKGKIKVLALGRTAVSIAHHLESRLRFANIDLDDTQQHLKQLRRYAAIAPWVVYLAPPASQGLDDERMKRFLACVNPFKPLKQVVYVSTTGVYGAAQGAWVTETSPLNASEPRAKRRIAAEGRLKRSRVSHISVLRAPGIYAENRLPIKRLQAGLPALIDADDVPTNHIHADDLARICWLGLFKSRNRRTYNAADGVPMMHAQYLATVAKTFGLAMPVQQTREKVQAALSPIAWSMLSSARRVNNQRLLDEWGITLKHPSMAHYLSSIVPQSQP
jgi:nucleoside-diphosphate-sugar epimerase